MSQQPNNPLHGVTLQAMLETLVKELGWPRLANEIRIRCFANDPSIKSSLSFLRRTPWARTKVESLYLCREQSKSKARAARQANAEKAVEKRSRSTAPKPRTGKPAPSAKAVVKGGTLSLKKNASTNKEEGIRDEGNSEATVNSQIWGKSGD